MLLGYESWQVHQLAIVVGFRSPWAQRMRPGPYSVRFLLPPHCAMTPDLREERLVVVLLRLRLSRGIVFLVYRSHRQEYSSPRLCNNLVCQDGRPKDGFYARVFDHAPNIDHVILSSKWLVTRYVRRPRDETQSQFRSRKNNGLLPRSIRKKSSCTVLTLGYSPWSSATVDLQLPRP